MRDLIHHFKAKKPSISYIYFDFLYGLPHAFDTIQVLDEWKLYQHDRVHAGASIIRAVLVHYKAIDEVPVNRFINDPQKMILGNHVIHTEYLNLSSFLVLILSHHRNIPPSFDTSILSEKSYKILKTGIFIALLTKNPRREPWALSTV
mgnify:FL=1